jgi:hypothetical protein
MISALHAHPLPFIRQHSPPPRYSTALQLHSTPPDPTSLHPTPHSASPELIFSSPTCSAIAGPSDGGESPRGMLADRVFERHTTRKAGGVDCGQGPYSTQHHHTTHHTILNYDFPTPSKSKSVISNRNVWEVRKMLCQRKYCWRRKGFDRNALLLYFVSVC